MRLPPARVLTALAWIIRRGSNPAATIDETRSLPLGEVMSIADGLDFDGLTLGDIEDLEEASGLSLADLMDLFDDDDDAQEDTSSPDPE